MTSTLDKPCAVSLRPAGAEDEGHLFAIYASTRAEELVQVAWDDTRKEAFLRMQWEAQCRCYQADYPGADFQVILVSGQVAGRLYVHRGGREIRVMDIALLPAYRGRGIGTSLLKEILVEGQDTGRPVTIHVESFNPARRLYGRLGFRKVANAGVYDLLEWRPPAAVEGEGLPR